MMVLRKELIDHNDPSKRCGAPYCGDKIKDKKAWRHVEPDGESFFHVGCCDHQGNPEPQGP